jgi:hypothetical protein
MKKKIILVDRKGKITTNVKRAIKFEFFYYDDKDKEILRGFGDIS